MQSVMQGHCFLWDAEGSKQVDSTSLIGSILAKKVFFFLKKWIALIVIAWSCSVCAKVVAPI